MALEATGAVQETMADLVVVTARVGAARCSEAGVLSR